MRVPSLRALPSPLLPLLLLLLVLLLPSPCLSQVTSPPSFTLCSPPNTTSAPYPSYSLSSHVSISWASLNLYATTSFTITLLNTTNSSSPQPITTITTQAPNTGTFTWIITSSTLPPAIVTSPAATLRTLRVHVQSNQEATFSDTSGRFGLHASSPDVEFLTSGELFLAKTGYPFNTYFEGTRHQSLVQGEELGLVPQLGPGRGVIVEEVGVYIGERPGMDLDDLRVSYALVEDSVTRIGLDNVTFVPVSVAAGPFRVTASLVQENSWFSLPLRTPVHVPTGYNLVIELYHLQTTWSEGGSICMRRLGPYRSLTRYSDKWTAYGDDDVVNTATGSLSDSALCLALAVSHVGGSATCGSVVRQSIAHQHSWTRLSDADACERTPAHPECRFGASLVSYVSDGAPGNESSFLLFGGHRLDVALTHKGEELFNDLWVFEPWVQPDHSGETGRWRLIQEPNCAHGARPTCRYHHAAAVIGRSMWLWGGANRDDDFEGYVTDRSMWRLDLDTFEWEPVQTFLSPPARFGHAYTTNGVDKMYIFGGSYDMQDGFYSDCQCADDFRQFNCSCSEHNLLSSSQLLEFDVNSRTWNLLSDTTAEGNSEFQFYCSALDTDAPADAMPCTSFASAVYYHGSSTNQDQLYIFGGETLGFRGSPPTLRNITRALSNEVWRYTPSTGAVTRILERDCGNAMLPPCRARHAAAVRSTGVMMVTGGITTAVGEDTATSNGMPSNDVWEADVVSSGTDLADAWQLVKVADCEATDGPSCRFSAAWASTAEGSSTVVFGGVYSHGGSAQVLSDTWLYAPSPLINASAPTLVRPTNGSVELRVNGLYFGTDASRVRVVLYNEFYSPDGEVDCGNVTLVESPTRDPFIVGEDSRYDLTCVTPPGIGANVSVVVSTRFIATLESNPVPALLAYAPPEITGLAATSRPTQGMVYLTVTGRNFGALNDSVARGAEIGSASCVELVWDSVTQVRCLVREGAGRDLPFTITVGGQRNAGEWTYSYDPPVLTSALPAGQPDAPTDGGYQLELIGSNFGSTKSSSGTYVTVGPYNCTNLVVSAHTNVLCSMPAGVGAAHLVVVVVEGQPSAQDVRFSFDAPVIEDLEFGPVGVDGLAGGLTVRGRNFGPGDAATVKIGSLQCGNVDVRSHTQLVCSPPAIDSSLNATSGLPVVVTVGGQMSAPSAQGFNYSQPFISSVSVSAPVNTTGGATLEMVGLQLGTASYPPTITVGSFPCGDVEFVSSSRVRCTMGEGAGAGLAVLVEVGGQVETASAQVSYAAPAVRALEVDNAGTSGGGRLVVLGSNFGPVSSEVTVWIGTMLCGNLTHASHTRLECTVPAGFGVNWPVQVTVAGQTSDATAATFSYSVPSVTSIEIVSGNAVAVHGVNFPVSLGEGEAVQVVLAPAAEDVSCADVVLQSPTRIECTLPAALGLDLPVVVELLAADEQHSIHSQSNHVRFNFTQAHVQNWTVSDATYSTTGGGEMALRGYFGQAWVEPVAYVGEQPCTSTQWVDETHLVCAVPPGVGEALSVRVRLNLLARRGESKYVWGESEKKYSYGAPSVERVEYSSAPPSGGTLVVVYGSNFGRESDAPVASVGAAPCIGTQWRSHGEIVCELPALQGTQNHAELFVQVGGQSSSGDAQFVQYDAPEVSLAAYSSAPTQGYDDSDPQRNATIVQIRGSFFGTAANNPQVLIGGEPCAETVWLSSQRLQCYPHAGVGVNLDVQVSVGGQLSEPALSKYSYDAPVVEEVAAAPGTVLSTEGEFILTVSGRNFGTSQVHPVVRVGTFTCALLDWLSAQRVTCVQPPGSGSQLAVLVEVGEQSSLTAQPPRFSYAAPSVFEVGAPDVLNPSGGDVLNVTGRNFGPENAQRSVYIGTRECSSVEFVSHLRLKCVAPAGAGSNLTVAVLVSGQLSSLEDAVPLSYARPVVHNVTLDAASLKPDGSAQLYVQGANFGPADATPWVYLSGQPCAATLWVSFGTLVCVIPPGTGAALEVEVRVGGQSSGGSGGGGGGDGGSSAAAVQFAYPAPEVREVSPTQYSTDDGDQRLQMLGSYFGSNATRVSVSVGGRVCRELVLVRDYEHVTCISPSFSTAGRRRVVVRVDGQASNAVWLEIDDPTIPRSVKTALVSLATILMVCLAVLLGAIVYFRANKEIRAASPVFCCISVVGGMVATATMYTLEPSSVSSLCHVSQVFIVVGFTLAYGPILLKNVRILKIFNNKEMQVLNLPDKVLLRYLFALLALDAFFLLPIGMDYECGQSPSVSVTVLTTFLLVYKMALLAAGVVIAYKSRVIYVSRFSERTQLGYAIYNIAFSTLVLVPISLFFTADPVAVYAVRCLGILFAVSVTMAVLFVPKFVRMWNIAKGYVDEDAEDAAAHAARSSSGLHGIAMKGPAPRSWRGRTGASSASSWRSGSKAAGQVSQEAKGEEKEVALPRLTSEDNEE